MKNLKAGYLIEIITWENDGDHYSTEIIDGLSGHDVDFYDDLTSHFRSGKLSNDSVSPEVLNELIKDLLLTNSHVSNETKLIWTFKDSDHDGVYDMLTELVLGYPVSYDYYFCRVVSEMKVYHLSKPTDFLRIK